MNTKKMADARRAYEEARAERLSCERWVVLAALRWHRENNSENGADKLGQAVVDLERATERERDAMAGLQAAVDEDEP